MPEAKSILNIIVSVLVGIVMLGMVGYMIYMNTDIWKVFSRQNSASEVIRNYSEYAAYDNTKVRGQDMVSLIAKTKGDPFVVVYNGTTLKCVCYDDFTGSVDLGTLDYGTSGVQLSGTLQDVKGVQNFGPDSKETDIQNLFLGDLGNDKKYGSFKTYLVYDSKPSTNVVGILAIME